MFNQVGKVLIKFCKVFVGFDLVLVRLGKVLVGFVYVLEKCC